MNRYDRRRMTAATIFTVAALSAVWFFNREAEQASSATPTASSVLGAGSDTAPPTSEYTPAVPGFVDGGGLAVQPQTVGILIGATATGNQFNGWASFQYFRGATMSACTTNRVALGTIITVTNLDNGQSIQCVNSIGKGLPPAVDIVVDTQVFGQLSNLSDAPIPVSVSW